MIYIMQGDSYSIPIEISTGENMFAIDISELDELEIIIGNIRKTLNKGTITFNDGIFYFPISQKETFSLEDGEHDIQVRVKLKDSNNVIGTVTKGICVLPSKSKAVL